MILWSLGGGACVGGDVAGSVSLRALEADGQRGVADEAGRARG
jgi:hypothetical protein